MPLITKIELLLSPSMEFSIPEEALDDIVMAEESSNSDCWVFDKAGIKGFSKQIERLFVVSNGGFSFQAVWNGDKATDTLNVSIVEFIELLLNDRIGKTIKYIVAGSV